MEVNRPQCSVDDNRVASVMVLTGKIRHWDQSMARGTITIRAPTDELTCLIRRWVVCLIDRPHIHVNQCYSSTYIPYDR